MEITQEQYQLIADTFPKPRGNITTVKVHPDGAGALTKRCPQAIGRSRGGLTTKIHMVAADARTAIIYALSPGQDHDAPHG